MEVTVLKAFTAYIEGAKTQFQVGSASIPAKDIEECAMIKNGLIKKSKPKET